MLTDFLKLVLNSISIDFKSWIYTIIFGLITFYIVKFYYKVKQYPSGPFPFPFVGNIFKMIGIKKNVFEELLDLAKTHGPIYTFWFGPQPFVIINDLEIAKEAFLEKKNEIAGRPQMKILDILFEPGATDVLFTDYGPTWESLRKVAHTAVRKYAGDEKLAFLVNDVVAETIDKIKKNEGIDKPFNPNEYISLTVYIILASTAFGKRYTSDDSKFERFRLINEEQRKWKLGIYFLASYYLPIIKPLVKREIDSQVSTIKEFFNVLRQEYQSHQKDYQFEQIRDFIDALIFAKQDSYKNEKDSVRYLTDENLTMTLANLWLGGSDTTQIALKWILLFMANYPEMQRRMRNEIMEQIGDRMAVRKDKKNCHFVNAFISEILRYKTIVPIELPHKSMCDVEIRGIKIPKDTTVTIHLYGIMHDPVVFDDPNTFKPSRFLESNGSYVSSRPNGFIPFGLGKCACLGERLALADLFLVVVNLLQKTSGYQFALPDSPGTANLTPEPHSFGICCPIDFNLLLKADQ